MKYAKKYSPMALKSFTLFLLIILVSATTSSMVLAESNLTIANDIEVYEQNGAYAKALEKARNSLEAEICSGSNASSQMINRLENKLLTLGYSRLLFDENYQPRVKLLNLLELIGMAPLKDFENAILQINTWAQKNLLRQGECWEKQNSKFEDLKTKIKPLLKEFNFLDGSCAHFNNYQGAIVYGASLGVVRLRLDYLVQQWRQGVRFAYLYFLSGQRPLELLEKENLLSFVDRISLKINNERTIPQTECEMMQLVWEQSEIPDSMREEVQVHFINAPMKKTVSNALNNEKLLRPNTNDTVEYWLKAAPASGRYLAISNGPYINRQDLVVRTISPKHYSFDTIGPQAHEQEKMAILLDELARVIFQIKELSEK